MKTIICDLDGTLTDASHRMHYIKNKPKDHRTFFKECINDGLHSDVLDIVYNLVLAVPAYLVLVSGRSDECRNETKEWLRENNISYDQLWMRRAGDYRPDYIVKQEIYDRHLINKDIYCVFDDRDQVVQMWRRNGLRCLQVADGSF